MNEKLEKMKPILDLIAKRKAIVSGRFELDELKKDPERLKGRNACKQLGKEEKMERRVRTELSRITAQLEIRQNETVASKTVEIYKQRKSLA